MKQREIIHLDMDAFYASVEQRDNPDLLGKPVIVGGSLLRGVVCACSYETRPYGVRSAMAMTRAVHLCPQAVVLPVRMARYREVSRQVMEIFSRYTDRVEPLSLDEAFLDVSGCRRLFGSGRQIAERIRSEVRAETGLAVSAGVAPNKFLAKLASEAGKPDGLLELLPEAIDSFLPPLPVGRLWGVGKTTAARLESLGVRTVGELRRIDRNRLTRLFGSGGEQLFLLARGVDDREVEPRREIKSISQEETFERDLRTGEEIRRALLELAEQVARRLRAHHLTGRCVTVAVRYEDFTTVTRSRTMERGTSNGREIYAEAQELAGQTDAGRRPVRLLRIGLSRLEPVGTGQAELFDDQERNRRRRLDQAVDQVQNRYGKAGVIPATLLGSGAKKGGDRRK